MLKISFLLTRLYCKEVLRNATMKLFIISIILAVLVNSSSAKFECSTDTTYTENGCNECTCNSQIGVVCSSTKPIANCQNYHQLRHCKIGSGSKKDACNSCWCVEDIGTVCSNKKCS